jgi:hypothetical protein
MDHSNMPPENPHAFENQLRQFRPRAPQVDLSSIIDGLQAQPLASPLPLPVPHTYRNVSLSWALGLACGIALMLLIPQGTEDNVTSPRTTVATTNPSDDSPPSNDIAHQNSFPQQQEAKDIQRVTPVNPFGIDFNELVTAEPATQPLGIRGVVLLANRATQTTDATTPSFAPSTTTERPASEISFDTDPQPVTTLQDLWQEFL